MASSNSYLPIATSVSSLGIAGIAGYLWANLAKVPAKDSKAYKVSFWLLILFGIIVLSYVVTNWPKQGIKEASSTFWSALVTGLLGLVAAYVLYKEVQVKTTNPSDTSYDNMYKWGMIIVTVAGLSTAFMHGKKLMGSYSNPARLLRLR